MIIGQCTLPRHFFPPSLQDTLALTIDNRKKWLGEFALKTPEAGDPRPREPGLVMVWLVG